MSNNFTVVSLEGSSGNGTMDSITFDKETVLEKTKHATTLLNLIHSRIVFILAKLKEGNESNKDYITQTWMDLTMLTEGCRAAIDKHWSTQENLHLERASCDVAPLNLQYNRLFNKKTQELDSLQMALPAIETFKEKVFHTAIDMGTVLVEQKTLNEHNEKELQSFVHSQNKVVQLIAEVGQKVGSVENPEIPDKENQKIKRRAATVKVGRAIINCLLSSSRIDFEQNPELLAIKEKYRQPLHM